MANLCKGIPVGTMSCGAGSIGNISISTIAKDFRQILSNSLDEVRFIPVKEIAERYFSHMKVEHYDKIFPVGGPNNPILTAWVFGFSPNEHAPEIWEFSLGATAKAPAETLPKNAGGIAFGGEPEVIQRLALGYGSAMAGHLKKLGVDDGIVDQALQAQAQAIQIHSDAMPVQDAIDLAHFLVSATIEFSRFKMGAATVGGPIEIAAVTKHEGFKWISRKHYFSSTLNPPLGG